MNERIRELAKQAGFMVDQSGSIMVCFTSNGDSEVKKFAELIVKECIRLCDQVDIVGADECIDNIKEHFEV